MSKPEKISKIASRVSITIAIIGAVLLFLNFFFEGIINAIIEAIL